MLPSVKKKRFDYDEFQYHICTQYLMNCQHITFEYLYHITSIYNYIYESVLMYQNVVQISHCVSYEEKKITQQ